MRRSTTSSSKSFCSPSSAQAWAPASRLWFAPAAPEAPARQRRTAGHRNSSGAGLVGGGAAQNGKGGIPGMNCASEISH